jgi:hypothetical protein
MMELGKVKYDTTLPNFDCLDPLIEFATIETTLK